MNLISQPHSWPYPVVGGPVAVRPTDAGSPTGARKEVPPKADPAEVRKDPSSVASPPILRFACELNYRIRHRSISRSRNVVLSGARHHRIPHAPVDLTFVREDAHDAVPYGSPGAVVNGDHDLIRSGQPPSVDVHTCGAASALPSVTQIEVDRKQESCGRYQAPLSTLPTSVAGARGAVIRLAKNVGVACMSRRLFDRVHDGHRTP